MTKYPIKLALKSTCKHDPMVNIEGTTLKILGSNLTPLSLVQKKVNS